MAVTAEKSENQGQSWAKNYLKQMELEDMGRIVTAVLDMPKRSLRSTASCKTDYFRATSTDFWGHYHWKIQRNSACEGTLRCASGNKY